MSLATVLIVEDDPSLREALSDTLELAGYPVRVAGEGTGALEILRQEPVGMVISDVQMHPMDGHTLLRQIKASHPETPVLLMTAFGSIEKAVAAMHDGAVDYLVKPFEAEVLVSKVAGHIKPANESPIDGPVAEDLRSREVLELARRVARSEATVLLNGESGTGKEVFARYIHQCSPRAEGPFIAINCAAIPENMLEAMLFGYEKGAFTGAYQSAPGKFEQAQGGTLLLDEISEMSLPLQAKLLRVLQERELERLGGRKLIELDVRVLATTNRKLREEVSAGRFREDLYYRISEITIQIPALRERVGDAVLLAWSFLNKYADLGSTRLTGFTNEALQAIEEYNWPGNVRELENRIKRAVIMADGSVITLDVLQLNSDNRNSMPLNLREVREKAEASAVLRAMNYVGGNVSRAAELLGISRPTLYDLVNKYGLK